MIEPVGWGRTERIAITLKSKRVSEVQRAAMYISVKVFIPGIIATRISGNKAPQLCAVVAVAVVD